MSGGGARLNELLVECGLAEVNGEIAQRMSDYVSLILRWNARVNLTAIRDEEGVYSRHIIESIMLARTLPAGIATLLDFGSGAGLPGIPIALCRPEIAVTLAESQGKKAAFLQEAVRVLGLSARVHAGRAEMLSEQFDCVTMRAVDRMAEAVRAASGLVRPGGWLALMTTEGELDRLKDAAGAEFSWPTPALLPGSERRVAAVGQRHG
ncbi:MAG: 16S rRNA (guanine(527)-N(7))-methyltransferase RsmG [Terracidiphilus sp.]